MMRHGSLFSGIGGFDLAAEWMGWENVFHCEWNEFGKRILNYYWPNAISYDDITKTDFTRHKGEIDIISGGFPCQPYSQAGKRLGKEDDRHLWPEMLRAIREIQPSYVVGENVRGLTNWNGGLVFDEVQADLEAEGYEVTPFLLPACAVNAPHRRDRIWFVAYSDLYGHKLWRPKKNRSAQSKSKGESDKRERLWNDFRGNAKQGDAANASRQGLPKPTCGKLGSVQETKRSQSGRKLSGTFAEGNGWKNFPTQPPVCSGNDGVSSRLDVNALYPHSTSKRNVKGGGFGKWRSESIKAYGNAIVPQAAYQIFKALVA